VLPVRYLHIEPAFYFSEFIVPEKLIIFSNPQKMTLIEQTFCYNCLAVLFQEIISYTKKSWKEGFA